MSDGFPHVCPGQDCAICRWLVWKDQWPRKLWKRKNADETRSPDGDGSGSVRSARVTTGNLISACDGLGEEVESHASPRLEQSGTLAKTKPPLTDWTARTAEVQLAGSEPAESHTKII